MHIFMAFFCPAIMSVTQVLEPWKASIYTSAWLILAFLLLFVIGIAFFIATS